MESRRAKNLEAMRFFTTTTVSLGLYTGRVVAERNPENVPGCVTEMRRVSRVIVSNGFDGLHDLRHFVADNALQHAIAHAVSVHNDASRQTFVVSEVGFQCS